MAKIGHAKKEKKQQTVLNWLNDMTAGSRRSLIGLLLLNTAVAVAAVSVSLVKKAVVDEAADQAAFSTMVLIMVLLQLFSVVGGVIESLLETVITEKYACQVRKDLFERLLKRPWRCEKVFHSEEMVSRITSDVEQITSGVSRLLISGGALVVRLILAFCLLWNYSHTLALVMIVITPVGVLSGKLISRGMNRVQKEYQQTEADYRIFLQERLSRIELVQIFGQEENSVRRFQQIQDRRLKLVREKNKWKVLGIGVISLTFTVAQAIAFIFGAMMISTGSITYGVMTAFLSLVGQIQGPVNSLASQIPQIVGVTASARRIMEMVGTDTEEDDQGSIPEDSRNTDIGTGMITDTLETEDVPLGIRAEAVTVGYQGDPVVRDLSFTVEPGQIVMIAGSSGIGKTTLLRAVMGFLKVTAGKIEFTLPDGTHFSCGAEARRRISYVPQGNTLLYGTIAENLRMGKSDATKEEMREALRVADALEFVEALPEGLDTAINEKAAGISEGQAQRISIARALLKRSSLLILDEATSALDENTEVRILKAISGTEHPTVLFVSHRRYLERYADHVIELLPTSSMNNG